MSCRHQNLYAQSQLAPHFCFAMLAARIAVSAWQPLYRPRLVACQCAPTYQGRSHAVSSYRRSSLPLFDQSNHDKDNETDSTGNNAMDDFLDRSFFDPEQVSDEATGPLRWFANLVRNNYNMAELLYAGAFFVIMIVVSQELFRINMYGWHDYVPFTSSASRGGGGGLF